MPAATSPSAMPFTSSGWSLQKSAICSNDSDVFSTSQTAVAFGISGPVRHGLISFEPGADASAPHGKALLRSDRAFRPEHLVSRCEGNGPIYGSRAEVAPNAIHTDRDPPATAASPCGRPAQAQQHDLADMGAALHAAHGPCAASREREGGVDHRPARGPAPSSGQTFSSSARGDRRLLGDRARRAGSSRYGSGASASGGGNRPRPSMALQEGDLHDAAVLGGGLVVAADIVAADHVEDQVGAAPAGRRLHRRDEILGRGS